MISQEPAPQTENELVEKLKRFNLSTFNHTFETFNKLPGTEEAFILMRTLASRESDRKFICLYGKAGCGKTHLIEATIVEWLKHGIKSRYNTMSQLIRWLKLSIRDNTYDEIFKTICERERLIIDDVGMGTIESKWEISELEDIVNERYHRRYYPGDLITIIATNKNIDDLPERIVSRFYDPEFGKVILLEAGDYRRRKT